MRDDTRRALELFVQKVKKLYGSGYFRHLREHPIQITLSSVPGEPLNTTATTQEDGTAHLDISMRASGVAGALEAPDEEALEALLLTARMLCQNNDRISFRSIAKNLLDDPGLTHNWKDYFADARAWLNHHLDGTGYHGIQLYSNEAPLTNREVIYVLLYGVYAHVEEAKLRIYEEWQKVPGLLPVVHFVFQNLVIDLVEFAGCVARITELELRGDPVPSVPPDKQFPRTSGGGGAR